MCARPKFASANFGRANSPWADTRERVLEGGEDAGDGDAAGIREELGVEDEAEEL